ncbi:ClpP family protease [Dactylococcopsis salina]|uniref:ATP-dependent Clp protease proteolytic subunit n=1 Tax=Dactylococcopsis salina (strain PCC 8305) TaxID=13035 RepID=K9YX88_DACS8|nr:ATP-dependent Clp protease proteolytic subunit [Dactylococcopsis salina]AFZ51127.1 protease subunit of ATP-dependent protease [Dactylococcopsis salina PCC 8305]
MYKYLLNLTLPLLLLSLTNLPASQAQGQPERRVSQEPNQSLPINEDSSAERQAPTVTIKLLGEINNDTVGNLVNLLTQLSNQGIEDVLLVINSGGGKVKSGMMAYEYLKNLPINLHTHNIAMSSSAASWIYCAGDKRTASPNSYFTLHYSTTNPGRQYSHHQAETIYEDMKNDSNFIEEVTESCTNLSKAETVRALELETLYTASEAIDIGLAEEIGFPSEILGQSCYLYLIDQGNKVSFRDACP